MNVFQKAGVFVVRVAGIAMIVSSGISLISLLVLGAGSNVNIVLSSLCWIIAGAILFLASKPIGKMLGDTLD